MEYKDKILKPSLGKSLRSTYAKQAIIAAIYSKLTQFIVLLVIATTFIVLKRMWWVLSIPLVYFAVYWKQLIFEFFLVDHVIEAQLGTFQWYSVVDDNLLLGAIPLKEDQHLDELHKLGVKLVISVVEPFELECRTLMGTPVQPEEWKAKGIHQVTLSAQDFRPPPFDILDQGAKLLDQYLSEGHRVYVHCKSGKGRSASVIAAYFFKYKNLDVVTAQAKLKARRSFVFNANSSQMRNMLRYAEAMRPGSNKLPGKL